MPGGGKPGNFGDGWGAEEEVTAPAAGLGGIGGGRWGGSGRPAVAGGCRAQFQLKKCPIVLLPRICVFLVGSSEDDPEAAGPFPARLGARRRPGEGQGPGRPAQPPVLLAGEALVAGGEGASGRPPASSALPPLPPLGARRRPLCVPGSPRAALLRRRRSWRLEGEAASAARCFPAHPPGVSRGRPAGDRGGSRPPGAAPAGSESDFGRDRFGAEPGGCVKSPPGRFQAAGRRLGAACVPSRPEPRAGPERGAPVVLRARPPCALPRAGLPRGRALPPGVPSVYASRKPSVRATPADPLTPRPVAAGAGAAVDLQGWLLRPSLY